MNWVMSGTELWDVGVFKTAYENDLYFTGFAAKKRWNSLTTSADPSALSSEWGSWNYIYNTNAWQMQQVGISYAAEAHCDGWRD